eukprot:762832-Prymnesium_polylepis.1
MAIVLYNSMFDQYPLMMSDELPSAADGCPELPKVIYLPLAETNALMRYAQEWTTTKTQTSKCPRSERCVKPAGHRGWCAYRFNTAGSGGMLKRKFDQMTDHKQQDDAVSKKGAKKACDLYPRPPGRARKEMEWDSTTGEWVKAHEEEEE